MMEELQDRMVYKYVVEPEVKPEPPAETLKSLLKDANGELNSFLTALKAAPMKKAEVSVRAPAPRGAAPAARRPRVPRVPVINR